MVSVPTDEVSGAAPGSGMRHNGDVGLRDFESIVRHLSEEEIDELQATIDRRRAERLASEGKDHHSALHGANVQTTGRRLGATARWGSSGEELTRVSASYHWGKRLSL